MAEKRKAPQGRNPNLVGEPLNEIERDRGRVNVDKWLSNTELGLLSFVLNWHGNMSFFNRTEGKICKEKHFINNIKN